MSRAFAPMSAPLTLLELPAYRLRVSRRARRARIRVSLSGEVEVVVPQGFDLAMVPVFMRQQAAWLRRTLRRVHRSREAHPEQGACLPERIELPAVGESWRVSYTADGVRRSSLLVSADAIVVCSVTDRESRTLLRRWLTERGRQCLVPWLGEVSRELGLQYVKATVRGQRTRWGSCSARGTVSLNRNLLFLSPQLVRYLFVHELCHTQHLNHSPAFWGLVARMEPDFRSLERALTHAGAQVPRWAHAE